MIYKFKFLVKFIGLRLNIVICQVLSYLLACKQKVDHTILNAFRQNPFIY